ncbi:MAG TPA: ELWxxDGT repeat protein, partial [Thermoanaerobaculia bacterium]|nr:ELWxxDGT repeat protein [Thermoanaerobaculia bacterium]
DRLLFFADDDTAGEEPWVTDGTAPGTFRLGDLNPGTPGSFNFTGERKDRGIVAGGRWYFGAYTHPDGWALWSSDGTAAGTQVVRRFPEPSSSVRDEPFAGLGGSLFFPVSYSTLALWRTDGTEAGTSEVKHLGGPPRLRRQLVSQGDHVFYLDGPLYVSDGTENGTEILAPFNVLDLTSTETGLFYRTWRPGGALNGVDADLWITTQGTSASIQHLAELESYVRAPMTPFREGVAFFSLDLVLGDGTAAGTSLTGLIDSLYFWDEITVAGGRLFFSASTKDGLTGAEPYVSDGTLAGTRLLRDIRPGPQGSEEIFEITPSTALGGRWFFTANDGVSGRELWVSDGTTFGTRRVRDIRPGPASSRIGQLTTGLGRVYFTADDGVHGEELWVSDGTEAGTRMVRDLVPGAATSFPRELAAFGHVVLFAADDPDHGVELWRTDGTEAGTVRLQDIAPGTTPSSPHRFTASGPNVYFAANDGATGFEPWAISRASLGSALAATKTATGEHAPGGTVSYTIVISNVGAGPHPDNPGDELVDVLPAGLTLVGATADTGSVSLDLPTRRVAWNGALPIGGSATLTIEATVDALPGAVLRNQADLSFDADGDGTNESSAVSDAPGSAGTSDPTDIVVSSGPTDFYTVAPCRAIDTRTSSPMLAGTPRTFPLAGTCGVPVDAKAVAVNLTVFAPTALGNVVAWPAGAPVPGTSSLNFLAGVNRANNAILELSGGGIQALARMMAGGEVHLILDVVGYFGESVSE